MLQVAKECALLHRVVGAEHLSVLIEHIREEFRIAAPQMQHSDGHHSHHQLLIPQQNLVLPLPLRGVVQQLHDPPRDVLVRVGLSGDQTRSLRSTQSAERSGAVLVHHLALQKLQILARQSARLHHFLAFLRADLRGYLQIGLHVAAARAIWTCSVPEALAGTAGHNMGVVAGQAFDQLILLLVLRGTFRTCDRSPSAAHFTRLSARSCVLKASPTPTSAM